MAMSGSKIGLRKNIRGQTEIIGLTVIVILLVFFGLIYLGFLAMKEESELPSMRTNIEAENALTAVMKVKMEDYDGLTVEELVIGCSRSSESCERLKEAVERAYGVILKPGAKFSFSAFVDEEELYSFGTCNVGIVSSYIFIEGGVVYETKLKLCERV